MDKPQQEKFKKPKRKKKLEHKWQIIILLEK